MSTVYEELLVLCRPVASKQLAYPLAETGDPSPATTIAVAMVEMKGLRTLIDHTPTPDFVP